LFINMSDRKTDIVIVGAGIIGLATALRITEKLPDTRILVLEKENEIGSHQTGHNSGVIHSGVYYRPGSLKARLCVGGAAAMISFCRDHGIGHDICGKVIVATDEKQLPGLHELHRRSKENNVPAIRLIGREELQELEPHAIGIAALHVPGTGIADYPAVTRKYAEIIRSRGAELLTNAEVQAIRASQSEFHIETGAGLVTSKFLINCAGLHSDRIARMTGAVHRLRIVPFRGEYYELASNRRSLVHALIYPIPDPRFPFLGVHFTRRVTGEIEAGPNAVLALKREGYRKTGFNLHDSIDTLFYPGFWIMARRYWRTGLQEMWRSASKAAFVRGLQKLVPEVCASDLLPAGTGVRAQALAPDGALLDDFHFVQQGRALHVCNVPSPAATASLMIGERIVEMAAKQFGLPMAAANLHAQ
jgi:(S)-2-hydroxyglutarate dehydrogenase